MGRSFLNAHGFQINLVDSEICPCSKSETTLLLMTQCFLSTEECRELYNAIEQILPKFACLDDKNKLEILLKGINLNSDETDSINGKIIVHVQIFLLKTKHF